MKKENEKAVKENVYVAPTAELFDCHEKPTKDFSEQKEQAIKLVASFSRLKINARLVCITPGAGISAFVFQEQSGSVFNAVKQHLDVIENDLGVFGIRVTQAYREFQRGIILGREEFFRCQEGVQTNPFMRLNESGHFVSLEIPSSKPAVVSFRDFFNVPLFAQVAASSLAFPLGKTVEGGMEVCRLSDMPHLMIAGMCGSGKSICINSLLTGLVVKNSPQQLRLLLIDPKCVELSPFADLPHSLTRELIKEPSHAVNALKWAIAEIDRRFGLLANTRSRDINRHNEAAGAEQLPHIVIVIEEIGHLMQTNKKETEAAVGRICQMGRAAGVHLVFSTQRPSAQVLSGAIRANLTASIVFRMCNAVESKIALGASGAEFLQGRGDMLYMAPHLTEPMRVQGCFISNAEVDRAVRFVKENNELSFDLELEKTIFA